MEIRKWHCYLADLNPRFGTEPGKERPVVVVQTDLLNEAGHSSTLICPLTTQILPKVKWLRVHLEKDEAGLKQKSDVLVDQIRAIDNRRLKKRLGILRKETQYRLSDCLREILEL